MLINGIMLFLIKFINGVMLFNQVKNVKYTVTDQAGRLVEIEEKTSILLTLATALAALAAVGLFALGAFTMLSDVVMGTVTIFMGLFALIYVFVLNHLRKKADMNVDRALIPTASGGFIEVRKVKSFWITLALAFTIIGIIVFIGMVGYGLYLTASLGPEVGMALVVPGIIGIIAMLIYAAILNFLRAKIDFDGDRVLIRAANGALLELYKRKSTWLLIAMIFTILAAILMFAMAALAITGSLTIHGTGYYGMAAGPGAYGPGLGEALLSGIYGSIAFIFAGIYFLIIAAVLNFLRVRGHIRPAQGMA